MQNKINLKSIAIGIVIGAVAALSIGAATSPNPEVGRFRLLATGHGNYPPELYKIDTANGQVWHNGSRAQSWQTFSAPNAGN